jgi:hypothetical protein
MRLALTPRPPALVAAGIAASLLLASCGGSDTDEPGGSAAPQAPVAPVAGDDTEAAGDLNYEGTLREPDPHRGRSRRARSS